MASITFSVPGYPKGKDRPRAIPRIVWKEDGTPEAVVTLYTPPETVAAEREVLAAFRRAHPRHQPFTCPVLVKFVAVFPVPPSWPRKLRESVNNGTLYCIKKPDKDNIEKLFVDALKGWAWCDDQQVMGGGLKRYGSPPRVDITIESLASPDMPPTPGQLRLEARIAGGWDPSAPPARGASQTKSGKPKHPPALQRRIDEALARDGRERRR